MHSVLFYFFIGKMSKMIDTCLKAIYLAQGNRVHSPWLLEDVFLVGRTEKCLENPLGLKHG